jgi:ferredoxin
MKNNTQVETGNIGIVFPVYYYGLPHIVENFIKELKISEDNYIFAVATCGGSVGVAMKQVEKQLKIKGAKLSSGFKILMPDNYQIMYDAPNKEKIKNIIEAAEWDIKGIVNNIEKHEEIKFHDKGKQISSVLGGIISASFKPNQKDKNFWTDDSCNGCGICKNVCPVNNIKMINNKPTWENKCEQCLACMQWCLKASIQYKKGTIKRGRYTNPKIKLSEMMYKGNNGSGTDV